MRILIVDDHAVVRRGLQQILSDADKDFEFGEAQEVELKGLSGAHQLFDIHWRREG